MEQKILPDDIIDYRYRRITLIFGYLLRALLLLTNTYYIQEISNTHQ